MLVELNETRTVVSTIQQAQMDFAFIAHRFCSLFDAKLAPLPLLGKEWPVREIVKPDRQCRSIFAVRCWVTNCSCSGSPSGPHSGSCLLYTSDAADERS